MHFAPHWHAVGRVHLHLAERKGDLETPFAFLATFTEGRGPGGKPRHVPLGKALRTSGNQQDREGLEALLSPVRRAARESPLVADLVSSGDLFHPLAWSAEQAYAFLRELPVLETSGVLTRVPDWWKNRPRPQVRVTVGERAPRALSLASLLDFQVDVALDGEPLSPAEWESLRAADAGLVLLRGQWVEADPERIEGLLSRWEELEEGASEGLTLAESLRLLAGADLGGGEAEVLDEGDLDWSERCAGSWLREALSGLRDRSHAVEEDLAGCLEATLRPYQVDGVRWLHALAALGLGACLADDMGLGKTLQVLALLLLRRPERAGPHLLVLPASLLTNWREEARRFAPDLDLLLAHPSFLPRDELKALDPEAVSRHEVVVTSYGTLSRLPWVEEVAFDTVVLDEAQAIKNPGTRAAKKAKQIQARCRVALTGTPVENQIGDLWSLFDFLNPGLLGGRKAFTSFTKGARNAGPERYRSLRRLLAPYILRRLKSDPEVAPDLPAKTEVTASCGLHRRQVVLYQEAVDDLDHKLLTTTGIQRRGLVLAFMQRIQQICNHPSHWLGDGAFDPGESGKYQRLREIAEVIASRQEKLLIFTRFRQMTGPLADFLAEVFGREGLVLHGGTRVKRRGELVESFQSEGGPPFFVLSLKAGGTGLNLTAANHVVHFDRWWNPAVESQATDRAYRIGQSRKVLVHKLVCRGTLEERIDALLRAKQELADEVLGSKEEGVAKVLTDLDDEALLDLVRLDLTSACPEAGGRRRKA